MECFTVARLMRFFDRALDAYVALGMGSDASALCARVDVMKHVECLELLQPDFHFELMVILGFSSAHDDPRVWAADSIEAIDAQAELEQWGYDDCND
jgi:hypothetical protein